MCQEKPDLRLRHGFHHQCHAHRSQSDAAERHGVTNCTVSMGSGQNSHDLTCCLCSQSWTSHNPSTSPNNQLNVLFVFFKFNLNLPCWSRQCELKEERWICFALKMSPHRVTGLIKKPELKREFCFYITGENKLWILFCCFQDQDHPLNLIFLLPKMFIRCFEPFVI